MRCGIGCPAFVPITEDYSQQPPFASSKFGQPEHNHLALMPRGIGCPAWPLAWP